MYHHEVTPRGYRRERPSKLGRSRNAPCGAAEHPHQRNHPKILSGRSATSNLIQYIAAQFLAVQHAKQWPCSPALITQLNAHLARRLRRHRVLRSVAEPPLSVISARTGFARRRHRVPLSMRNLTQQRACTTCHPLLATKATPSGRMHARLDRWKCR